MTHAGSLTDQLWFCLGREFHLLDVLAERLVRTINQSNLVARDNHFVMFDDFDHIM